MGYKLRRMIRDGAPPRWTPLMRFVAGEIADTADPDELPPYPGDRLPQSTIPIEGEFRQGKWRDGLAERCGMSARAISRTLADLAAAAYEMRAPIIGRDGRPVTDSRGRLVFAAKRHALRFQVPSLPPRPIPQSSPEVATNGGDSSHSDATFDAQSSPEVATNDDESSPDLATNTPQRSPLLVSKVAESGDPISSGSPSKSSPHLSPRARAAILAAVPDATETEIDAYAAEIEKDHAPDNLGPYIARFPPQRIAEAIGRMRGTPADPKRVTRDPLGELLDVDPAANPDEAAEVLAILGERGAREPALVLRAEIGRGNGYKLLGEARNRIERRQASAIDPAPAEAEAEAFRDAYPREDGEEPTPAGSGFATFQAALAAMQRGVPS